jgi:hypothetical protein
MTEGLTESWRRVALSFATMLDFYDEEGVGTPVCTASTDASYWSDQIRRELLVGYDDLTVYERGVGGNQFLAPDLGYWDQNRCKLLGYSNVPTHTYCEMEPIGTFDWVSNQYYYNSAINWIHNYDAGLMMWFADGPLPNQPVRNLWTDLNHNHIPELRAVTDPRNEIISSRPLITTEYIIDQFPRDYHRFIAFLSSCNQSRWMHLSGYSSNPPNFNNYNTSEALLARFAVAVVAATNIGTAWGAHTIHGHPFYEEDMSYAFIQSLTYGATVGEAYRAAATPASQSAGLGCDGYTNLLHYNIVGNPELRLFGE